MKSENLLSYIGDIDPRFVGVAEQKVNTTTRDTERSPRRIRRFVPAIVCGVVALAVVVLLVIPFGTPFGGFVLTAYAAGDDGSTAIPTVLRPDVDIVLAEYTPLMSSVPGYPFQFDIENGDFELQVSVDWGVFVSWEPSGGAIRTLGNNTTIQRGTTIYWCPDPTAGLDEKPNATIIVKAVDNGRIVGSQEIIITYSDHMYRAKLVALETK